MSVGREGGGGKREGENILIPFVDHTLYILAHTWHLKEALFNFVIDTKYVR